MLAELISVIHYFGPETNTMLYVNCISIELGKDCVRPLPGDSYVNEFLRML